MTAIIASVCCIAGAVLFFFYNEKSVMDIIAAPAATPAPGHDAEETP